MARMSMMSKKESADGTGGLERTSLGIVIGVLVQAAVGMGVNLYADIPNKGNGVMSAFGQALTSTPGVLIIHGWLGLLLVGGSLHTLMTAMATRRPVFMVTSILGMLSIIGAAFSGASFVNKGESGSSVMMAVLTGVALVCYLANVLMAGQEKAGAEAVSTEI